MAKKKTSNLNKRLVNAFFLAFGIYLVVTGILTDMSPSWAAFCIALGLGLHASGAIGFAKMK